MPVRSITTSLVSVAMLIVLATGGLADDLILIPNSTVEAPGGKLSGQIQSETPTTVSIKPGSGAAREVPVDQVASIGYSGQPATLPLAETRESSGLLAEAMEQYKAAANSASGKPLIAQAAEFGEVRSLAKLAEVEPPRGEEAMTRLSGFLSKYPTSRHSGPALEWLAKLAMSRGETDRADQALTELAKISWATDRAAVLKARVQSMKGQHDAAIEALDTLIGKLPKGTPELSTARLVRAEALAAAGKFPEAEAAVREVIKDTPPEEAELQAHAYNTLGDCLKSARKPKDALFAYLHTDVLYDKDKEQHARSLAGIAAMWMQLKRDDRANEASERLKQLYPQSSYLKGEAGATAINQP